jgi:hypothetical protein
MLKARAFSGASLSIPNKVVIEAMSRTVGEAAVAVKRR